MEQTPRNFSRPSAIPRLSKQPVSKPSLRHAASKETFKSSITGPRSPENPPSGIFASRDQHSSFPDKRISASSQRLNVAPQERKSSWSGTKQPKSPCSFLINDKFNSRSQQPKIQSQNVVSIQGSVESNKQVKTVKYDSVPNGQMSLSERAMETLQSIPSSPAQRGDSSFFGCNKSPKVDSRPNSRIGSRPKSSSAATASGSSINPSPAGFRTHANNHTSYQSTLKVSSTRQPTKMKSFSTLPVLRYPDSSSNSVSHSKLVTPKARTASSKILNSRLSESRQVRNLTQKPSTPALQQRQRANSIVIPKKKMSTVSTCSPEGSSSVNSKSSRTTSISSLSSPDDVTIRKSSSALRDQIAKAKSIKRASILRLSGEVSKNASTSSDPLDFELSCDPFNQNTDVDKSKEMLKKRIQSAQKDGKLNISSMGLTDLPNEVFNMYSPQYMENMTWSEAVDLKRLVAADNEIEEIPDKYFPDSVPDELCEDDEDKNYQFHSLEKMDFRGNKLRKLPLGLRRLEFLTTLNLLSNNLTNDCLQVISQLSSLRDLNLDQNRISGKLDVNLGNLKNLKILNLRHNEISHLPESIAELTQLRVLDLAENNFVSLPFNTLSKLPLTDLDASKNNLSDVLVPQDIDVLQNLQVLNVTCNSLTSLYSSTKIRFPELQKLLCASNRLKFLPSMESWPNLVTIDAEDNCIESLPADFFTLPKIRNVNLNGNSLRELDERLGKIESLEILYIKGNPLRERKFSAMSTYDLKKNLLLRLEPETEDNQDIPTDEPFIPKPESALTPMPTLIDSSTWTVKPTGVLDRSNTQSYSLNPDIVAEIAATYQIKILQLHHNNFRTIPQSIAFFATTLAKLDLSHNEFTNDTYMAEKLNLPALKELNLSSNSFNSLQPLMQHLQAPYLEKLDVSFNRLSSLPVLRNHFPILTTLLTSHNTIKELLPESIKGMHVVDCSSNELNSLNVKIGLLGGLEGLRHLDVRSNRFKVPKHTVLETGTTAILSWLREKIPAGEIVGSDGEDFVS